MHARDPDEFSLRQWPDWSIWRSELLGRGFRARGRASTVALNSLALLALVYRVPEILDGGHGAARTAAVLGVLAFYAASYPLGMWFGPVASHRNRTAIVVAMYALGITPALLLGAPDHLVDLTFALAVALMLLPLRWSLLLGLATVAAQTAWMWFGYGRVDWLTVGTLLGVTFAVGAVVGLIFTIGHLRVAREQVRVLAVARERERVARDLHDILGHSLSTMTVKTGLARRILESGGDTAAIARAITELRELEGLSRQALSDVRATVSEYREVTLSAEIAGARAALRAAEVQADLPAAVDGVAPELQGVFGYVVREAVTNVLRHSDAAHCRVRLGRDWVEITDDGAGSDGAASDGNGLVGLAERLALVSGTVEHGRRPGGGFRVLARGPSPSVQRAPDPSPVAEAGTA